MTAVLAGKVLIGSGYDPRYQRTRSVELGANLVPHTITNVAFLGSHKEIKKMLMKTYGYAEYERRLVAGEFDEEDPIYDEYAEAQAEAQAKDKIEQTVPQSVPQPPPADEDIPF